MYCPRSKPYFLRLDHRLGESLDSGNQRLLAQISVPKLRADSGRKSFNPISPQEAQNAHKPEISFCASCLPAIALWRLTDQSSETERHDNHKVTKKTSLPMSTLFEFFAVKPIELRSRSPIRSSCLSASVVNSRLFRFRSPIRFNH